MTKIRHHVWVFHPIAPDFDAQGAKAYLMTELLAFVGNADNLPDLYWQLDWGRNSLTLHAMVADPADSK